MARLLASSLVAGFLLASSDRGDAHAAGVTARRFVYAALGDSSGVGVGAQDGGYVAHVFAALVGHRPDAKLVNLCRSGASSHGVLADQVPRLPAAETGVVTIGIGVNDLARQVAAGTFAERLEAIAKAVNTRTKLPVVISNLPDVSQAPVLPLPLRAVVAEQVRRYNQVIADVAIRHRWVLADIYTISQRELPKHPEFFSADGFHPSDAGYRFWAANLWPRIATVVAGAASGAQR